MHRLKPFSLLNKLKALSLDFSHNNLRDVDIKELIIELGKLKSLKSIHLNLSHNIFGSKSLESLEKLRKEYIERNVEADINVSFNTRMNLDGCQVF